MRVIEGGSTGLDMSVADRLPESPKVEWYFGSPWVRSV
jgi:hypothetical protein